MLIEQIWGRFSTTGETEIYSEDTYRSARITDFKAYKYFTNAGSCYNVYLHS